MLGGMVSALYSLVSEAAGSIPYGSRTGMDVTIIDMTGINTDDAVVRVRHTTENARQFCDEYLGDRSESCVTRTLREVRISDAIKGNCSAGQFVNLGGEYLRFAGPNFDHDAVPFRPEYKIYKRGAREFLDGSSASGYAVNLEQFRVLCPNAYFKAERAFAVARNSSADGISMTRRSAARKAPPRDFWSIRPRNSLGWKPTAPSGTPERTAHSMKSS